MSTQPMCLNLKGKTGLILQWVLPGPVWNCHSNLINCSSTLPMFHLGYALVLQISLFKFVCSWCSPSGNAHLFSLSPSKVVYTFHFTHRIKEITFHFPMGCKFSSYLEGSYSTLLIANSRCSSSFLSHDASSEKLSLTLLWLDKVTNTCGLHSPYVEPFHGTYHPLFNCLFSPCSLKVGTILS